MMHLCNPLLPKADTLLPYLHRIDESRWYSNSGPLVKEYEERLGKLFNCHVVATSSGTTGLTASLSAKWFGGKSAVVPSFTFVATANALKTINCGIHFVDVNPDNWSTYGSGVLDDGLSNYPGVGVMPFGSPVPYVEADHHPFVIDAAAAFDAYASGLSKVGNTPVVISTHATKCFSTSEGGLILSTDDKFIQRVREIINHGITLERDVPIPGINGKLSEYHAAIGLASLDSWKETRHRWLAKKIIYMKNFEEFSDNPIFNDTWVGPTFGIDIKRNVDPVILKLAEKGITARRIWGRGIHRYPAYSNFPRSPLPVTERLADEVLFLPFWIDAHINDVLFIARSVKEALA